MNFGLSGDPELSVPRRFRRQRELRVPSLISKSAFVLPHRLQAAQPRKSRRADIVSCSHGAGSSGTIPRSGPGFSLCPPALKDLREYLNRYVYLPRLENQEVLVKAVQAAVGGTLPGPFAYAERWDEKSDTYLSLAIEGAVNAATLY